MTSTMTIKDRFLSSTPKAELFKATKPLVDGLLAANTSNRNIRASHVSYLQSELINHRYVLTNQGIGLDVDGVLIDGQHRLLAIRNAGYPAVDLLIVYGLPRAARAAVDLGIKRTYLDLMHFAFDRPDATSSMLATARFWGMRELGLNTNGKRKPTGEDLLGWYEFLLPALKRIHQIGLVSRLSAPVLAAVCHRLTHRPDDSRPLLFVEQLISGANLDIHSPALKLRTWLAVNKGGGSEVQNEKFDRTATALIAYLEDRTVDKLYARKNSSEMLVRA